MPGAQRRMQASAARQAAMAARDSIAAKWTLQITGHAMPPVLQIYRLVYSSGQGHINSNPAGQEDINKANRTRRARRNDL